MLTSIPAVCAACARFGSSHVAILARAMDIPAVMGAVDLPGYDLEGVPIIVDGHYGEVTPIHERLQEPHTDRRTKIVEEELKNLKIFCISRRVAGAALGKHRLKW